MIKKLLLSIFLFSFFTSFTQEPQRTFVPDDNFEQTLIDLGYDDVLDDHVLSENIKDILQLDLNLSGVADLTGLESFTNLQWLRLDNRLAGSVPLTEIDVTSNLNLEILLLPGNSIKEIDLSQNTKLRGLDLESNQLERIVLSNNAELQSIVLFGNKLKELDLSKNKKLELYILSNNELTSLNLQNGNNINFGESVELTGNPDLKCIQVDDAEFSINNEDWRKDDIATFSEDCSESIKSIFKVLGYFGGDLFYENDLLDNSYYYRRTLGAFPSPQFQDDSNIIFVTPNSEIKSVFIEIQGPISHSQIDNEAPFSLFGENEGVPIVEYFPEGEYTANITAYTEKDLMGTVSETDSVSFTILDNFMGLSTAGKVFTANGQEWQIVSGGFGGSGISPTIPKDSLINFEAFGSYDMQEEFRDYVEFTLIGPSTNITTRDYERPYHMFNDSDEAQFSGREFPVGEYTLTVVDVAKDSFRRSLFNPFWKFNIIESEYTYVPDDNFEQVLIALGYDELIDDYVLTTNIENVTELDIEAKGVIDLTGIQGFKALEVLFCGENYKDGLYISEIDISANTNLRELYCSSSLIESIDLKNNALLETLSLPDSFIDNLDISANDKLKLVDIGFSKILELDVSQNPNLISLVVSNTEITELNLSNNLLLEHLKVNRTMITNLDVSQQKLLKSFEVRQSLFNQLDLVQNTSLENLDVRYSNTLSCIQVPNVQAVNSKDSWLKDDSARYSIDCDEVDKDSDDDGVADMLDVCPNTPAGQSVNAEGCSLSQYADIAVQNVSVGLASFLCSEPQNCTVDVAILRDVDIDIEISVIKDDIENVYDGTVSISNPLSLENLTAGEYTICATRIDIPNFMQCYQVTATAIENSVRTTIVMQNPGQAYNLVVEGNKKYEVFVNGISTIYEFDSVDTQTLEIPLQVGANDIKIIAEIECESATSEESNEDDTDDKSSDKLLLFPTLSDGLITIENNQGFQIHGITVTGLSGLTTKDISINGNPKEMKIDMNGAAKGMYIVRIQKASGPAILKKILIR